MSKKHIIMFVILITFLLLPSAICFASYSSPYPEPTNYIKKGSIDSSVKWVQDMLNHCGFKLSVDGICGTNTYQAITNFQGKHSLQIDGIVGPKTIDAIKKAVLDATSNRTINDYLFTNANVNLRQGPRYQLFY